MTVDLSSYILRASCLRTLSKKHKEELYEELDVLWNYFPKLRKNYQEIINQVRDHVDSELREYGSKYRKKLIKTIFINLLDKNLDQTESLENIFEFYYKERG